MQRAQRLGAFNFFTDPWGRNSLSLFQNNSLTSFGKPVNHYPSGGGFGHSGIQRTLDHERRRKAKNVSGPFGAGWHLVVFFATPPRGGGRGSGPKKPSQLL